jgi:HEAT repeat protein
MRRFLQALCLSATIIAFAVRGEAHGAVYHAPTKAHGGVYVGPGSSIPPGGLPGAGSGPTGPTPATGTGAAALATAAPLGPDFSSWQIWWGLNRAPFLDLKATLARHAVATSSDDAILGRDGSSKAPSNHSTLRERRARAVTALTLALSRSRAPDLTTAALLALAKIGSARPEAEIEAIAATIRPQLRDNNQEIAETAAVALGALAHPSCAPLLVELLEDSTAGREAVSRAEVPYRTRAFAAYGLGLIGQAARSQDVRRYVVRHLAGALEADHTATSDVSVACLCALGIVHVQGAENATETIAASSSASVSNGTQALYLMRLFKNRRGSDVVRGYIPLCLARAASASSPDIIADALAELCPVLEMHAREAANVQQGVIMALPTLVCASETPEHRKHAALEEASLSGDHWTRNIALLYATRACAGPGASALDTKLSGRMRGVLAADIARGSSSTRPWAALALGILEHTHMAAGSPPSRDARSAVRAALLERRGPEEIGAYCLAAGLMHDTETRDALVHVLVDTQEDEPRAHAAIGLGLLGDANAIAPLRKAVADARYRPLVLRDAAIALGLLGDRDVSAQLSSMLAETQSLSAQSAIASALGFIGDDRSIEPLVALVESKTTSDRTKAFAAAALGSMCDDRRLPWNCAYALDVNYGLSPPTLYDPAGGCGILDLL